MLPYRVSINRPAWPTKVICTSFRPLFQNCAPAATDREITSVHVCAARQYSCRACFAAGLQYRTSHPRRQAVRDHTSSTVTELRDGQRTRYTLLWMYLLCPQKVTHAYHDPLCAPWREPGEHYA